MSLKLDDLRVGDVIRTTRTHKVRKVEPAFVGIADVNSGQTFGIARDADHGTLSVEVVKKAAKAKPKVGDVLTADQVREHQWKRGSVLSDQEGYVYTLSAKGFWFSPDEITETDSHVSFAELEYGSELTVVHLP